MPLKRCGSGGKGWKYGDRGKCYTGPGAKKKAIKQAVAINMSKKRRGERPEPIVSEGRLKRKARKKGRMGR